MSSTTREKIALLVFAALVILGLGALTWYLSVGKTWNVAAASIDDATGQMEGYVAILYEGTVIAEDPTKTDLSVDADKATQTDSEFTDKVLDDTAGGQKASETSSSSNELGSNPTNTNKSAGILVEKKPIAIKDVSKSYEEKGADVYVVDATDLAKYRDGLIVRKGDQRFGVLSVALMDSGVTIQEKIDYFIDHEVDFVVALVPNKYVVQNLESIDVVISTNNKELATFGETVSGTFYVNTPFVDSVGVTLVSPHNVVSAKVIQEL